MLLHFCVLMFDQAPVCDVCDVRDLVWVFVYKRKRTSRME